MRNSAKTELRFYNWNKSGRYVEVFPRGFPYRLKGETDVLPGTAEVFCDFALGKVVAFGVECGVKDGALRFRCQLAANFFECAVSFFGYGEVIGWLAIVYFLLQRQDISIVVFDARQVKFPSGLVNVNLAKSKKGCEVRCETCPAIGVEVFDCFKVNEENIRQ